MASLTVLATDTLAIGGAAVIDGTLSNFGTSKFATDLSGAGQVVGSGPLVFDGALNGTWSGPATFGGTVQVAKSGNALLFLNGNLTVTGFTLTSGRFQASNAPGQTLTVNGNAAFNGGTLQAGSLGVLDVNGDVAFAGTACTASPNIRCSGNWTGASGYAPTNASTVTFDGTAPQTVAGAAAFPSVQVNAGAAVTVASPTTVGNALLVSGALTCAAATTVAGDLTVNGTLTSTAGALDANGPAVVNGPGVWTVGATAQTLGQDLSGAGQVVGSGPLVFDGALNGTWSGPATFGGTVQVAKSGNALLFLNGNLTVTGFTLTSGRFQASNAPGQTLTVNGNAAFNGGTLQAGSLGVLDVNGDVAFAGTACTASPNIRCSGNWTGASGYAPTNASTVTFDGTAPQTVAGAAAFPSVQVNAGAAVTVASPTTVGNALLVSGALTCAAPTTVAGDLTVNGTLTSTAGALDANGPAVVNGPGVWTVGATAQTLGQDLSGAGQVVGSGPLVFDGALNGTWSGPATFGGTVQVAKSGNALLFLNGNLTVTGFTLTSGRFQASNAPGQTLTVNGNAAFNGGTLQAGSLGVLDVNGDVAFAGTACTASPNIRCSGNWTGASGYAPTNASTVTFDGTAPQTVAGAAAFPSVQVNAGAAVTVASPTTVGNALLVSGALTCAAATTVAGDLTVNGTLTSTAGALDANGPAVVNGPGVWTVGATAQTLGQDLSGAGQVVGSGPLVFDGALNGTWSGPATFGGTVQVAKSGNALLFLNGNLTVTGFTLTSGRFQASNAPGQTLTVNGNAAFNGGTLQAGSLGVLDVNGDVAFAGTACTASPNIRCSGNWTGASGYAPTNASTVTFDGTAPQTVAGAAAFPSVQVNAGAAVTVASPTTVGNALLVSGALTCAAPTTVAGDLTVNGTLTSTAGALDANGPAVVNGPGVWTVGATAQTLGQDLSGAGQVVGSGPLVFDGALNGTWSGPATFGGTVQVAKSGNALLFLNGNLTVTGFTLTSGRFQASNAPGQTLTVNGNAAFNGGTLQAGSLGVLDVNGDVAFAGTACTASPNIRCSGNWTGASGYAPTNASTVTFDGTAPQTVAGAAAFPSVQVNAGAAVTVASPTTVGNALLVSGALTCAAPTTVAGDLTVNGTLTSTAGALDANGPAVVNGPGVWTVGATAQTLGQDLSGAGQVVGSGPLVFDGALNGTWSGPATFGGTVQVAKSGNALLFLNGNLTVTGFTLTSGRFQASNAPGQTLTVNGNAAFNGGTLQAGSLGVLDVNGDVAFAGTACTASPNIRCSGNWTGASGYAPTNASTVTFDGTAPQTVAGAAAFPSVQVNAGAAVTVASPTTVGNALLVSGALTCAAATTVAGDLTVNGTLTSTAGALDANGPAVVNGPGVWTVGATAQTLGQDLSGAGQVVGSGPLVFDGALNGTWSGPATFGGTVQVAKSGNALLFLNGNLTVTGFTLTSGRFQASNAPGQTLTVNGNAAFNGGTLQAGSLGVLDVNGDVAFAGTACTASPNIRCSGNWTGASGYAPTNASTVTFDGNGPATISPAVAGGAINFPHVVLQSGIRNLSTTATWNAMSTTVSSGAALRVGSGSTLSWLTNAPFVQGTLGVDAGATLALGPSLQLAIPIGGRLSLIGTPSSRARLSAAGQSGFGVTVNGHVEAMNFAVDSIGSAGLVITGAAVVAGPPFDLRNGLFDKPFDASSCLLSLQRPAPFDLRYPVFENSNGVNGSNLRCLGGSPINVVNWSGAFAGESLDDDPSNLVTWSSPQQTGVGLFAGIPGVSKATLVWSLSSLVDASSFVISRANAAGTFSPVFETPFVGAGPYAFVDEPLVPLATYQYKLLERLTHGVLVDLGTTSVTPFTAPPPANVLTVGPTGAVGDLQGAINAAVGAAGQITVIQVAPGTYSPFTLSSTPPGGLRILAEGAGVFVDTANGPVIIENTQPGNPIEIRGLHIGNASSAHEALLIRNCQELVIVDDSTAVGGSGRAAVDVSSCASGVALTRFDAAGAPGVLLRQSSFASLSGGTVASVSIATGSYLQDCGLGTVSVVNDGTAVREHYSGGMPTIDAPSFVSIGTPMVIAFAGDPLSYWALVGALALDYVPYPGSFIEMPQLIGLTSIFFFVELFADGMGAGQYGTILPPDPALLGLPLSWQAVAVVPPSAFRLTNVVTVVPVI